MASLPFTGCAHLTRDGGGAPVTNNDNKKKRPAPGELARPVHRHFGTTAFPFAGHPTLVPQKSTFNRTPLPDAARLATLERTFKARFLQRPSEQELATITGYPQHLEGGATNPKWLGARRHRCTGSRVASIGGMSKYDNPDSTLQQMLWSTFQGNAATAYGSCHEDDAQDAYLRYLRALVATGHADADGWRLCGAAVRNMGLVVDPDAPMFAMSPDGVAELTWRRGPGEERVERRLVEYKCPYKLRDGADGRRNLYPLEGRVTAASVLAYPPVRDHRSPRLPVPDMYQCQIQWGMAVLRDRFLTKPYRTDFVVWCPCAAGPPRVEVGAYAGGGGRVQVTTVDHDPAFTAELRRVVGEFWAGRYVRAALCKRLGCLLPGDIRAPITVSA